jgi:hypothetical protein
MMSNKELAQYDNMLKPCSTPDDRSMKSNFTVSDFFTGKAFCPFFCDSANVPEPTKSSGFLSPMQKPSPLDQGICHEEDVAPTVANTVSPVSTFGTLSPDALQSGTGDCAANTEDFSKACEEVRTEINFDDEVEAELTNKEGLSGQEVNEDTLRENNCEAVKNVKKEKGVPPTDTQSHSNKAADSLHNEHTFKVDCSATARLQKQLSFPFKNQDFYVALFCLVTLTLLPAVFGIYRMLSNAGSEGHAQPEEAESAQFAPRIFTAEL